ncbi:DNA-damage-inducible protein F [hydrothermal vent metagenome]|uniref:DNA-damage-inducible protein F n=1 Tax=hydrothermal vent metagenome TaxID=652676 RepID=A0A3B0SER5_9ZZZZ
MWQIAIPAIITNISIPLLGLADAFIMGHLPDPRYLGAIALGAMIISILYNSVNFLRMATTGFTAQADGGNDAASIPKIYLRASLMAVVIGIIFILLKQPVAAITFSLTGAAQEVEALAREYFLIRIWGAPFALLNFVAVGWLLGLHQARLALWIQLTMNICNILLNILFVYGLGMDVDGVALGTILSEGMAGLLAFLLVARHYGKISDHGIWSRKARAGLFNRTAFGRLFALNRDIFIRTVCLTGSMASFTILGANMSTEILAANAILMNLQMVTSYGLDGFAQAAEVLVGKEVGRKSRKGLHKAVLISGKWALITAILFTLTYFIFGDMFIRGLTNITAVQTVAGQYLIWVIILPLVSVWSFHFDGIFIGATAGKYMRNGMVISTIIYIGSLMIFMPIWQNHGLWLSYAIFLAARGMTLAVEYPKIARFRP